MGWGAVRSATGPPAPCAARAVIARYATPIAVPCKDLHDTCQTNRIDPAVIARRRWGTEPLYPTLVSDYTCSHAARWSGNERAGERGRRGRGRGRGVPPAGGGRPAEDGRAGPAAPAGRAPAHAAGPRDRAGGDGVHGEPLADAEPGDAVRHPAPDLRLPRRAGGRPVRRAPAGRRRGGGADGAPGGAAGGARADDGPPAGRQ